MKKRWIILGVALLLTILAISSVSAESAVVMKADESWTQFDGNGDYVTVPIHYVWVTTNSKNGQININVHGKLPEGEVLPDKALVMDSGDDPIKCTYEAPYWKYTLSPSGNIKTHCSSEPFGK